MQSAWSVFSTQLFLQLLCLDITSPIIWGDIVCHDKSKSGLSRLHAAPAMLCVWYFSYGLREASSLPVRCINLAQTPLSCDTRNSEQLVLSLDSKQTVTAKESGLTEMSINEQWATTPLTVFYEVLPLLPRLSVEVPAPARVHLQGLEKLR